METRNGGLSLGGVLLVVFIVLKLVGTIDWSWVWVLSPLWITFLVVFVINFIGHLASTPSNNFKCVDKNAKWDDDWYLKMNGGKK